MGSERVVRWPYRLALSLVLIAETFLVVRLVAEGVAGNVPMALNSAGLIVSCVLAWRGIPWGRWAFLALLAWRLAELGVAIGSLYEAGDHRLGGTLMLGAFYLVCGAVVASPLGSPRKSAPARP